MQGLAHDGQPDAGARIVLGSLQTLENLEDAVMEAHLETDALVLDGDLDPFISEYNPNVQAMDTIKDAVEEAFSLAGEQDVIIAFGSLSFIGEMTDIVENL